MQYISICMTIFISLLFLESPFHGKLNLYRKYTKIEPKRFFTRDWTNLRMI